MSNGKSKGVRFDLIDTFDPRIQGQPAQKGTLFRYVPAVGTPVLLIKTDDDTATAWAEVGSGSAAAGYAIIGEYTFEAPAVESGEITLLPGYSFLRILIGIAGFDVADIAAIRFNEDNGANYWYRFLSSTQGNAGFGNTQAVSATQINLAVATSVIARLISCDVLNIAEASKCISARMQPTTGAAGTAGTMIVSNSEWVNAIDPIESVNLLSVSGNNFLAGTKITILGA